MKKINDFMKYSLLAIIALFISACSSGGTGAQNGLNLTGNWLGTTVINGETRTVTMSLAQSQTAVAGVIETSVDGSLLIDGICVFNFSGGVLNLRTGSFTIGAGNDFSLITTATNSVISGAVSSLDDDPTDNEGCGTFQSRISLNRTA